MNPERWRQIERLYHSALERPSREREAFRESECRSDEDLRLEVQALLSRAASAESFLDRPAAAVTAQMVSQPAAPVLTGRRLGVYVVQAPLGAGGMGVVYRALDTNLNRLVAERPFSAASHTGVRPASIHSTHQLRGLSRLAGPFAGRPHAGVCGPR